MAFAKVYVLLNSDGCWNEPMIWESFLRDDAERNLNIHRFGSVDNDSIV